MATLRIQEEITVNNHSFINIQHYVNDISVMTLECNKMILSKFK